MSVCLCGCGRQTMQIDSSCAKRGLVKGMYRRYIHGHHNRRGQPTSPFKTGVQSTKKGYKLFTATLTTPRRYVHRAVAEAALGRPLPPTAVVHHVNGDKGDNRPCNLVICENESYHKLLHKRQRSLGIQRIET